MTMHLVLVAAGLAALAAGGELLVRGAVATARTLGVSPLVVGLTVVGFGTSAPELVVSVDAALSGSPAIALGNVVGSNIANCLLVLGVAAVISPLACPRRAVLRDGMSMLAATAVMVAVAVTAPVIGRVAGVILILLLAAWTTWSFRADRRGGDMAETHRSEAESLASLPGSTIATVAFLAAGLLLLAGGAHLLVQGAVSIARELGVAEVTLGLTLVAVGTSLPELAISIVAAVRGRAEVAVGNVLGSNLFNILGIIGVTATLRPIPVDPRIAGIDAWIMLGAAVVLLPMMLSGRRLGRAEGVLLLGGYAAWIVTIVLPAAGGV